jgi:hypothetical protein
MANKGTLGDKLHHINLRLSVEYVSEFSSRLFTFLNFKAVSGYCYHNVTPCKRKKYIAICRSLAVGKACSGGSLWNYVV